MGSVSILLADDSITIQKVVGIIFGSDDYSLTIVDNGKSAVEKAKEIQPDVLLIDALMPGMSGYEVCEAIRKEPALATKPLLLLTGSFEPFDEDKARKCGADDHIVKPFESQNIIAKVKELLELGSARGAGAAVPAEVSVHEPDAGEETFAFEQTAFEAAAIEEPAVETQDYTFSFNADAETTTAFAEPEPVTEPEKIQEPERSLDDPWGAFTTSPEPAVAVQESAIQEPENVAVDEQLESASELPDVMEMMSEEPVPALPDHNIGASWVPVEEQTFEFREEIAAASVSEETAISSPEPVVEKIADVPSVMNTSMVSSELSLTPDASASAVVLTDDQLKAALLSASKETIERIVWEIVPDLAEVMIKEAIKRITEER